MVGGHDIEAVKATLRVLGEAGRGDLMRPGILDEAWVGMTPTAACLSPRKNGRRKGMKGRGCGMATPPPLLRQQGTKGEPQSCTGQEVGATGGEGQHEALAGTSGEAKACTGVPGQVGQATGRSLGAVQPLDLTQVGGSGEGTMLGTSGKVGEGAGQAHIAGKAAAVRGCISGAASSPGNASDEEGAANFDPPQRTKVAGHQPFTYWAAVDIEA
ncbi:hypothetical protein NDU88_001356 [Pleurodeles waltl]|uniref:Uncharacterized protein n=1 Tax=Pleurodeles waltl TaxID=8319 RepID=A0AAV7W089_PLEWA|nr:hypothetical protein NDU88_001356 [Pleurodeles waltl]